MKFLAVRNPNEQWLIDLILLFIPSRRQGWRAGSGPLPVASGSLSSRVDLASCGNRNRSIGFCALSKLRNGGLRQTSLRQCGARAPVSGTLHAQYYYL